MSRMLIRDQSTAVDAAARVGSFVEDDLGLSASDAIPALLLASRMLARGMENPEQAVDEAIDMLGSDLDEWFDSEHEVVV